MEGKPFLQLEIDEHSGDAGIITRLEAFLDSIKNAKTEAMAEKPAVSSFMSDGHARKIYIPYMSDHAIPFVGAFRACGVEAEVMRESDEETVQIGRKHTLGKECFPCILTTGDMLKTSKRADFDPDKSAFFMPSGSGPCRFGQYHRFHRMVLSDHGLENVPIYSPNQDDRLYQELDIVGGKFMRLGWRAIVATDFLIKMLHQTRPYERTPGETDRVYAAQLARIGATIEKGGDVVFSALSEAAEAFLAIPKTGEQKPVVGIVGEIYIRSNRYSNNDLVRRVEEFGGEAWLAPITEWITYVNYTGKKKIIEQGGLSGLFQIMLTQYIQNKDEHRMEKIFEDYLRLGREPRIKYVLNQAMPYLDESFEGEAILTIGKSIDFIHKGASGIINSMPFTCMPGMVSSAIMTLIQNKYSVPVLNVAYDGQGESNTTTRLEAFMHQVTDYFHK